MQFELLLISENFLLGVLYNHIFDESRSFDNNYGKIDMNENTNGIYMGEFKCKQKRNMLRFMVEIVNHCNLNCVGCGHFSPLADAYYLSIEEFQRDCERLSYLSGGVVERIEIMGGEPLLHPNVIKFIEVSRTYFQGEINLSTNGILVDKQPEEFFLACAKYDVSLAITLYPINLNWEKIYDLANKYKVTIKKVVSKNADRRLWFKNKRDLSGSQDIVANFIKCRWGNNCIILEHGRLATCVMPFKTRHYNDYYKTETFKIPESDSIDIYKVDSLDEILDFLSKPISTCRYCLPDEEEVIEWKVSKKQIYEWS